MSKDIERLRKGSEIVRYAESHGARVVRQSGSHVIVELPDGTHEVIPCHGGHDLGKGLRCKIVKHLIAAGLTVLIIVPILINQGV